MLDGELYVAADPELVAMRRQARDLTRAFNQTTADEMPRRTEILRRLFGAVGERIEIEPPFYCDYGSYIFAGDGLFMNFNCVILDCATVHLGRNVMMGPAVQIYGAHHPLRANERIQGPELASPIRIGDNVWLGGGAIVCPGVTIGDNTTIGAGSVVTKSVPANVLAAGNPCRVIRTIA
ncbi:MAG: sugar O-acetyltransferase [Ferruginibacter sp.]|nr:sugar O-acetyltransferase [Cytophagales bacterium]